MDEILRAAQRAYHSGNLTSEQYIQKLEQNLRLPPLSIDVEIENVLVASTAHITHLDSRRLDNFPRFSWVIVPHLEYGWWIYVPAMPEDEAWQTAEQLFSINLIALMKFACNLNCQWLKIDRDGPQIETFPVYDW